MKKYSYNFPLDQIPERSTKDRAHGVTMVMDKGMSFTEVKDLCEFSDYIDFVKLGFGTSFITPKLEEKIACYQKANIHVFLGGTLFEAFFIRKQLGEYEKLIKKLNLKHVEISDGTISLRMEEKIKLIQYFKSLGYVVLSEVGKKKVGFQMFPFMWVDHIKRELEAGADYVITESRESGNVGIYRITGKARNPLINKIIHNLPIERIIFEAPQKNQQHFFIKKIGCNVNLGNIAPGEIIALETMRLGLRGDTFFQFLK